MKGQWHLEGWQGSQPVSPRLSRIPQHTGVNHTLMPWLAECTLALKFLWYGLQQAVNTEASQVREWLKGSAQVLGKNFKQFNTGLYHFHDHRWPVVVCTQLRDKHTQSSWVLFNKKLSEVQAVCSRCCNGLRDFLLASISNNITPVGSLGEFDLERYSNLPQIRHLVANRGKVA